MVPSLQILQNLIGFVWFWKQESDFDEFDHSDFLKIRNIYIPSISPYLLGDKRAGPKKRRKRKPPIQL